MSSDLQIGDGKHAVCENCGMYGPCVLCAPPGADDATDPDNGDWLCEECNPDA